MREIPWGFSTGHDFLIQYGTSATISSLCFELRNQIPTDSQVRLLKGRQLQYQIQSDEERKEDATMDDEEEGFVTLVRFTEENQNGKATALINWKLLVVEFLPEEDAVLVLLLCITILRSVSEMRKEDIGSLLTRRRVKEPLLGARDWGSVILHPSSVCPSISSPHVQPWYRNPKAVMAPDRVDHVTRQGALSYPAEEGSDQMYKRVIIG